MKINQYHQVSSNNKMLSPNERTLLKLKPGEVFKAEIADINQGKLLLLLKNGMTMEAKLQNNLLELKIGQTMYFKVQTCSNEQIILEILPDQYVDSKATAILDALDAANISPNKEHYKMVEALLTNQLSIDSHHLQTISHLLKTRGHFNLDKIIFLLSNDFPLDEKNIVQLDGYIDHTINLHHQVEELMNYLVNFSSHSKNRELLDCFVKVDHLFNENNNVNKEINIEFDKHLTNLRKQIEVLSFIKENDSVFIEDYYNNLYSMSKDSISSYVMNHLIDNNIKSLIIQDNSLFNFFFDYLNALFENKEEDDYFERLLSYKIRDFFNEIKNNIHISLEQLKNKDSIKDSLNRLYKYTYNIENILKNLDFIEAKELSKTSRLIKNNLEFMNQLSKFDSFVQIPIKMNEYLSQAELYVFRNNKKFKKTTDSVSALIALDLNNIGNIEVFVLKNDKDIFLQFKLEKESYINIIKEHIDELINSLIHKGYNIKSLNFKKLEESFNFLKPLEKDDSFNEEPKRFSFDMRV